MPCIHNIVPASSDTPYWYTQIQYLDQTSLSGAEHGQTSHNTTSEIPNVMEHIGGGASLGGHIPAESKNTMF